MTSTSSPIIVLGAARSGTKFLRDCLGASPELAIVPYDVNYVWRYGQESYPHDILPPEKVTPKIESFIRSTLPKLAKAEPGQRFIEKTVSNTLRVPFVNRIYPNASFVNLLRDGRDVTESSMRLWEAPPDKGALWIKLKSMPLENMGYVFWYAANLIKGRLGGGRKGGNVWGPRYPNIESEAQAKPLAEICALQWRYCVEQTQKDLKQIDPSRVFNIRYEEIVASSEAITRLAQDLGLEDPEACAQALEANIRPAKAQAAWTKLSDDDKAIFEEILAETLNDLGYA